jgi:hypothetical protein
MVEHPCSTMDKGGVASNGYRKRGDHDDIPSLSMQKNGKIVV